MVYFSFLLSNIFVACGLPEFLSLFRQIKNHSLLD